MKPKEVGSQSNPVLGLMLRIASLVVLLIAWEIAAKDATPFDMPPPSKIIAALLNLLADGSLLTALANSLQAFVLGFSLAVAASFLVAVVMTFSARVREIFDVYLSVLLSVPWAAIVPLVVIAVGIGLASRVVIAMAFSAPIIAVNFVAGLNNTDPTLEQMARSFSATRTQTFRLVKLPASMPLLLTGIRLGLARAFVGMVVAELLLVSSGVGKLIVNYETRYKPDFLFATIITLVLLGGIFMAITQRIERRVLWWQQGQTP